MLPVRVLGRKLYFNVLRDGTLDFPRDLYLVGRVDIEKDVRLLTKEAQGQLSNLMELPLSDASGDTRVLTNEDFTYFNLLRRALNVATPEQEQAGSEYGFSDVHSDLVTPSELVSAE